MPTSPVKQLFGPLQPRKNQAMAVRMLNANRYFPSLIAVRLGMWTALFAVCGFTGVANVSIVEAQTLQARISLVSVAPALIRIEAEFPTPRKALSFRNAYAGVLGLGERIKALEATKASGESVAVQKLGPGEYQTSEEFKSIRYDVNLAEPARPAQMSHVSWLNREQGLLMLADLLPVSTKDTDSFSAAQIKVDVPVDWTVASNAKLAGAQFSTGDPENAVFMISPSLQQTSGSRAATSVSIISSGQWPFSHREATEITGKLIEEYARVTRFELKRSPVVMLVPFPGEAGPQSWTAETRGNVVVLLLGRNASGKRVLSHLGIVLTHEIFHLWVPNSLRLEGDYDWFFEGFTLYQALRMALRLDLISFDDYLETIARVYDAYSSSADHDRLSLIEASERRWTSGSSLVYEKGMLAAFIYDLSLRKASNCRTSLDDVYRELFRSYATGQGSANEIIIKLLGGQPGLESFAKDYIESAATIDLDSVVSSYGLQLQHAAPGTKTTKLTVSHNLNKEQRALLGCVRKRK